MKKVVKFYGREGKNNGVTVKIGNAGGANANTATRGGKTTITLDLTQMAAVFGHRSDGSNLSTETAATVAHEGQHGIDEKANGMPQNRAQEKAYEVKAFTTQSFVNHGLGVNSAYGVWTNVGGFNASAVDSSAETSTQSWCLAGGTCK